MSSSLAAAVLVGTRRVANGDRGKRASDGDRALGPQAREVDGEPPRAGWRRPGGSGGRGLGGAQLGGALAPGGAQREVGAGQRVEPGGVSERVPVVRAPRAGAHPSRSTTARQQGRAPGPGRPAGPGPPPWPGRPAGAPRATPRGTRRGPSPAPRAGARAPRRSGAAPGRAASRAASRASAARRGARVTARAPPCTRSQAPGRGGEGGHVAPGQDGLGVPPALLVGHRERGVDGEERRPGRERGDDLVVPVEQAQRPAAGRPRRPRPGTSGAACPRGSGSAGGAGRGSASAPRAGRPAAAGANLPAVRGRAQDPRRSRASQTSPAGPRRFLVPREHPLPVHHRPRRALGRASGPAAPARRGGGRAAGHPAAVRDLRQQPADQVGALDRAGRRHHQHPGRLRARRPGRRAPAPAARGPPAATAPLDAGPARRTGSEPTGEL